MDSHIEKEKLLTFGKKQIDVSNVSYGRVDKASRIWNKVVQKEDVTVDEINKMSESVGLYLIRQDFDVLLMRFTFFTAIKEYIKRSLLTSKVIRKSNKQEYEEFQDWVYFTLTGKKKEMLQTQADIMDQTVEFYQQMEKQGIKPSECLKLLQTLVVEQAKDLEGYTKGHEA